MPNMLVVSYYMGTGAGAGVEEYSSSNTPHALAVAIRRLLASLKEAYPNGHHSPLDQSKLQISVCEGASETSSDAGVFGCRPDVLKQAVKDRIASVVD